MAVSWYKLNNYKENGVVFGFGSPVYDAINPLLSDLKKLKTERVWDLRQRFIGDQETSQIATALQSSLAQTLLLSCNQIGANGMKALAPALASTPLHTVEMNDNKLGDHGTKFLAGVLPLIPTLTTLSLQYNDIGKLGVNALLEALQMECCQLTQLHLSFNHCCDDATIRRFATETRLKYLDVRGIELTEETDGLLRAAIPSVFTQYDKHIVRRQSQEGEDHYL